MLKNNTSYKMSDLLIQDCTIKSITILTKKQSMGQCKSICDWCCISQKQNVDNSIPLGTYSPPQAQVKARDRYNRTTEQNKQVKKTLPGNSRKVHNQGVIYESAMYNQKGSHNRIVYPNPKINQAPTIIQPQINQAPAIIQPQINQAPTIIQPQTQSNSSIKIVPSPPIRFTQTQSTNTIAINPTRSHQPESLPRSDMRSIQSSQIIQNTSSILSQKPEKQLKQKQDNFRKSPQFIKAQKQQSSIQQLLQVASQSHEYKMYGDQKPFYLQALNKVQQIQNNYSLQSISEIKSHIYSQLVNAVIAQNKNEKQVDQYLSKAIEAYDKTVQSATIEERITLLNNYSVFKRNRGNLSKAKDYLGQAINLMNVYYVVSDQRKFLSLINLACLEYESSNKEQAQLILDKVIRECKKEEIKRLAYENKKYYK